jgi:hypothetical protein
MSTNSSAIPKNSSNKGNNNLFGIVMIGLAVIIIIFFVYSTIMGYRNYRKYSPYLIDGITDATVSQKFKANRIQPASDGQYGTEFSYSFWMFIKDTNFTSTKTGSCSVQDIPLLHVFHKGSYDYITNGSTTNSSSGVYYPLLQMPGVWLYPNTNKLNIRFNTYDNVVETADIGNIPLNMWVNVIIILIGSSIDVYVNGNLKKRSKLNGVPKINYGDFYTTNWGGFQGFLSRLRYFNYAIQPFQVDQIFNNGPSTQFATNVNQGITEPSPTLSPNYWMTTGYPNSYGAPGYNQNSQTTA